MSKGKKKRSWWPVQWDQDQHDRLFFCSAAFKRIRSVAGSVDQKYAKVTPKGILSKMDGGGEGDKGDEGVKVMQR
jgi:hypothetical protein